MSIEKHDAFSPSKQATLGAQISRGKVDFFATKKFEEEEKKFNEKCFFSLVLKSLPSSLLYLCMYGHKKD